MRELADIAKEAIREAGGIPFEFNTIGVDDGIAMGHIGMRYSLPSRELIADSAETVINAHWFDGVFVQIIELFLAHISSLIGTYSFKQT